MTADRLLESAVDLKLIGWNPANSKEVRKARPKAKAPDPVIWTAEKRSVPPTHSEKTGRTDSGVWRRRRV